MTTEVEVVERPLKEQRRRSINFMPALLGTADSGKAVKLTLKPGQTLQQLQSATYGNYSRAKELHGYRLHTHQLADGSGVAVWVEKISTNGAV